MSSLPDIDPYAVLGVAKDAPITEIRAAHRKRVLKCHPDKIQDESQRNAAQDEFQRVQQAYELLSDEMRRARYDQKAKLAELRREILERRRTDSSAYSSPRASGSSTAREYRDGRIVEERVPVEVFLDEEIRFTEEPRSMSRKYEDFGMRPKPKGADEKKKARTPVSSVRAAKELAREATKASHSDRAKHRDRERRRQASEKHDHFAPHVETDDDDDGASESSGSEVYYVRMKRPSASRRDRESRSRPVESSRRRSRRHDEDDYSDRWESKLNSWHDSAQDYIERSKFDVDRRPRASRSPQRHRGYESAEPESSASRRSGRSTRSTRNRSSSRSNSYEHLESPRSYETKLPPPKMPTMPTMPTSATSPGVKGSGRPSFLRSATAAAFTRPKREGSSHLDSVLYNMAHETVPPRSSKRRDRYDSGYSSPSTPEMPGRSGSPKASTRYKIVDAEPIVIEPSSTKSKHHRSVSREPTERAAPSARTPPKRSSTYAYAPESSPRFEVRSSRPSRPAHGDVEYTSRIKDRDIRYTKEIRPSDINYSPGRSRYYYDDYRHPPAGRRQSATA